MMAWRQVLGTTPVLNDWLMMSMMPASGPQDLEEGRGDVVPSWGTLGFHGPQGTVHLSQVELFTAFPVRCLGFHHFLESSVSCPFLFREIEFADSCIVPGEGVRFLRVRGDYLTADDKGFVRCSAIRCSTDALD